jgi:hypothetical protein
MTTTQKRNREEQNTNQNMCSICRRKLNDALKQLTDIFHQHLRVKATPTTIGV